MGEETLEEFRQRKKEAKARMTAMQKLPYEVKIKRAERRAWEFVEKLDDMGLNAHVSVGGLDSIVLLLFLRKIGINIPAISVSVLEDRSIQRVHTELGVTKIKPDKSKVQILNEVGFPVISKKIAGRIDLLQHPTDKNKTVRHAIITGECGAQGHYAKNSRMKLPQKWLNLFGGYENENEGVNYGKPDFLVSNKCCLYMKEKPCDRWAREHKSKPFLGLMASEGGQREEAPCRAWLQLLWQDNYPICAFCTVYAAGPSAAGSGSGSASARDLRNHRAQVRWYALYYGRTEDRLQHVWIRNPHGKTAT